MAINEIIDDQQYLQTLESVFPTKFEPGSLADRLLTRGRQEGRQEGRLQGLEEARQFAIYIVQLLQRLLGEDSLQPEQLQNWSFDSLKERVEELQRHFEAKSN